MKETKKENERKKIDPVDFEALKISEAKILCIEAEKHPLPP